ncbi:MAG: outer membrane beta-barrel protein [Mariprofundus sp.]
MMTGKICRQVKSVCDYLADHLHQDYKPYAGIGISMFGLELKTGSVTQKNNVFGGFVKFGLSVNDFVAAELRIGGTGTGTSSYSAGTPITTTLGTFPSPVAFDYSMRATYFISYLIKPQYEIAPNLHLYGLLGGTTVKVKGTFSVQGIKGSNGVAGGLSYGAGAEYKLADRLNIAAEWAQYWTDVKVCRSSTARIWGVVGSVSYHF